MTARSGGGFRCSNKPAEKPVSLHPLKFEEAVRDLLRVRPDKAKVERSRKD